MTTINKDITCQSDSASWEYLRPRDVVDIIAPASPCHPSTLEKVKQLLTSWELEYRIPNDLFGDDLLFSNTNEKRFKHLEYALTNPDSKAVWCLLGGYGSTKLIPLLSKIARPKRSKIFIGFSDITALHIFLQGKWGWSTVHGPSARQAALNKVSVESIQILKNIIFRETNIIKYDELKPLNTLASNQTIMNSPIIGGNLHLIQASIGTPWQIDAANKILFIEEINERAYRIDRILEHFDQVGIIKPAKAILFGDIIGGEEPDGRILTNDAIKNFANRCPIPVFQISNVGHGLINNPIIFGHSSELRVASNCSLTFRL